MKNTTWLLVVACCFALGCAEGNGRTDTSVATDTDVGDTTSDISDDAGDDTSPLPDSAPFDSGSPDTSAPPIDSGPDTRPPMDTGPVDTGSPDTGTPDTAMPDTAMPDTAMDTTPECTRAADCDDGVACNGDERCVGGSCRPGTPVVCTDRIECTVDSCTEPSGECAFAPRDGRCAAGEVCDATMGCISSCSEDPCRVVSPQCGCPTGQGCYVGTGGRVCVTAGTVPLGGDCSTELCAPGAICVETGSDTSPAPICKKFCDTDADCDAGLGDRCLISFADLDETACTTSCVPETNVGCGPNTGCRVFTESATSSTTLTDCVGPTGAGGQGVPCVDSTDCQGGFACFNTGTLGLRCLKSCRLTVASDCAGTPTCVPIEDGLTYAGHEYGACL